MLVSRTLLFFLTRLVRHGISDIYNRDEVKFQNREKICILGGDKKPDPGISSRTFFFILGVASLFGLFFALQPH